jgi:hypothetical protein
MTGVKPLALSGFVRNRGGPMSTRNNVKHTKAEMRCIDKH